MARALKLPRVSVLMAAHNAEAYLNEAIRSILAQTFADFEFIIIDDGSTDGTRAIVEHFKSIDPRIRHIDQENRGLANSLNRGLLLSRAELVARMDADDISHPDRLLKQVNFMDHHLGIEALGTHVRKIDATGNVIGLWRSPSREHEAAWRLPLGSTLPHPSVMLRKSAIEAVGGYDIAIHIAEDYDLWCRLVRSGYEITNLPECLLDYRVHSTQISSVESRQQQLTAQSIAFQHLQWAVTGGVCPQAAADLRQLCDSGFGRRELTPQRINGLVGLISQYISAVTRLHSDCAGKQARRYLMRKILKAASILGFQADSSSAAFMLGAIKIL